LRHEGLLESTLVIVTSDHGEGFGDHSIFGHASSLYLDEIGVPLVILAPGAPAGREVLDPVSLRDLPVTILDQTGLGGTKHPFQGRSLASYWKREEGQLPGPSSPALSEYVNATAFSNEPQPGLSRRGFQMSLVARGMHYVRDGTGGEQ